MQLTLCLSYRRYSNTQILEASCVLIWAPRAMSACKHPCKIRPPFPVENYSNCSRNILARKYLGEIPTIHSWWKFFSSHTACFNSMTFSNLLKSGPLILLRPYLYLFGNLYRIAFDYSLLKVKRNWSGHKSFLISYVQASQGTTARVADCPVQVDFWVRSSCSGRKVLAEAPQGSVSPEQRGWAGGEGSVHGLSPWVAWWLFDYFRFTFLNSAHRPLLPRVLLWDS